ncbi:MAG: hypothetical protein JST01_28695 [Cyanobacteria bacterium SZAS TMP-1]|nr:hypothetical protein [Cyanobacteria bacterium SZAS TMP-1]
MFGPGPAFGDRDLLVCLGPIGTVMLALSGGLMGLLKLSQSLGQRLIEAPFIVLAAITLLVPYFGAVVANHVFYSRVFPGSPAGGDRDLIVALGPLGTFMLALCACMGAFLGLCKRLGSAT